ncbi:MAG: DotD/TraH family lipoprotein [Alphaproteobacteria bacterium]|nr:DotD/TraH family lipoprotein [Alphaproteobacteria bacterium]
MTLRWRPVVLGAFAVAALTGGCAPFWDGPGENKAAVRTVGADPAEVRLAAAAERAEAALSALARIASAQAAPPVAGTSGRPPEAGGSPSGPGVPAALLRPVTLDWIGPVETLAETLAHRAGYRYAAAGTPPARPAMVAVTARDVPLIEVLRDAGLQAGSAATLVVDAGSGTVRLDWTGEPAGAGHRARAASGEEDT